ncbi:hypothetical protein D3C73_522770 [compost metagenome]|nr:hypothetical protein [Sphingobacterium sp. BIGb0116]
MTTLLNKKQISVFGSSLMWSANSAFESLLVPQTDNRVDQGCFDRVIADRE